MINSVELVGYYGGDESHSLSAWTSTSRELTAEKRGRMGKLLRQLAQNGHHTPFEKSMLHFLVTCDTASHIHILKHRIGVCVNGESARYKELKSDKYVIPQDWPVDMQADLDSHMRDSYRLYHLAIERLEEAGIDRKRAKESARFFLPYANQLVLDCSWNFRSFMHFQGLRNKPDAQLEIREIAATMLRLVRETGAFDLSLEAFGYGKEAS
jgi:thymidylate synthase (FAD)